MIKQIVFDLESNGLLDTITALHCISYYDISKPESEAVVTTDISAALAVLQTADELIGHNIIAFDIPAIERVTGIKLRGKAIDTIILAPLAFPHIRENRKRTEEDGDIPGKLLQSHSLKAWGHRLKCHKGDYVGGWEECNEDMLQYCLQDVIVTKKLFEKIVQQNVPQSAWDTELELAPIMTQMEHNGFSFDIDKAHELYAKLSERRQILTVQAAKAFKPWFVPGEIIIPKRNITYSDPSRASRVEGAAYQEIKYMEFNPNSRPQIVDRLRTKYRWEPIEFTDKGNVMLNNEIMEHLPYPEAQALAVLMLVQKRIAQLAEGDTAWLRMVREDGKIHGRIIQNGCCTGRASHYGPNMAQIPASGKEYGEECRALFKAEEGNKLVGCDATSLEIRCLAGYLKPYDGGSCITTALYGTKEDHTDIYWLAAKSCGVDRKTAKTLVLAMIYGAANPKLGWTVDPTLSEAKLRRLGAEIRKNISESVEGFQDLADAVKKAFNTRGYIKGLDGRPLKPRNDYSSLNTLLQSAGAIIAKRSIIELVTELQALGFTHGEEFKIVGFIHDEIQVECLESIAEGVANVMELSWEKAGEFFKFPCKMAGESKIGDNWSMTH